MTDTVHAGGFLRWREDDSPIGFLGQALGIAVASILLTLIFPALIASHGNVFYASGLRQRLHASEKKILDEFDEVQKRRKSTLERLDVMISGELAAAHRDPSVLMLFQVRDQVAKDLKNAKPPISVIPFYLSPQMLLWPAIYTCLLWIAIILSPARDLSFTRVLLSRKTLELGIVTYLFYEWPLWLRNFVLGNEGRVVFAYPNSEIHMPSFITQEAIVFGFCVLLAVIWRQWVVYLLRVRHDDPEADSTRDHIALLTDRQAATSFVETFYQWTFCSVVLALGFLGFTAFFWNLVAKLNDQRYLLSAVLAHVLWGITWIVVSLPLLNEWRLWDRCRTYALQALATSGSSDEAARKAAFVKDIQPVSGATLTFANAASVISFLLPIVQAFVGHST